MSDSNKVQEHNEGQDIGAHGDFVGQLIYDLTPIGWIGDALFESESFVKGRENGQNNRPKK